MQIEIGKRAQRQVERINHRWREKAEYPLLFEQELEAALRLLVQTPRVGVSYPTKKRPHLLRILLRKTEYHVYFSLERDETVIVIHSVWGARRGRGPML